MAPGPASDFLNLQKCISKLRLVGKGTGPLSPKAETNLPPFLAALIHPGPCLLLVLSSTCASSLHLPQKGTSLPLFSTSATIMELRLYKTLDYTPRFRLAASSYTGWARTEGAVTWSRQASDDAQPNPALGYMLLPDPQEWRTHWCPLCCHVPHQVGSVYKRTERYKLGRQGPGRLHMAPHQAGLALDPCLDPKHHGKEQQKQAQLEGTIY